MAAYQLARHRIVWWTVLCSLQLTRPVNSDPGIKGMTPFPIFGDKLSRRHLAAAAQVRASLAGPRPGGASGSFIFLPKKMGRGTEKSRRCSC